MIENAGHAQPRPVPANAEECRQMAAALVDNLLARAIVKASRELAFANSAGSHHHQQQHQQQRHPDPNNNPAARHAGSSSTTTTTDTTPTISWEGSSQHSQSLDINGNTPEIQIDLVGPRTPSPVEESSFELPAVQPRQYKFKVDQGRPGDDAAEPEPEPPEPLKPVRTIQFAEVAAKSHLSQEVEVATTPELEQIDLEQAHQLSKHIVADVINQAVRRLNDDLRSSHRPHMTHEPESNLSRASRLSGRSLQGPQWQNNCSWLTRTRQALRRIMRHACICAQAKSEDLAGGRCHHQSSHRTGKSARSSSSSSG